MQNKDEGQLFGRIPSVTTHWRGSGTIAALVQAVVISGTIGLILSGMYLGIRTQITYWEWHGLFTWIGLIPAALITLRFWRSPSAETPAWWNRPDRVWLYGPTIWLSNLWPFLLYLWWTKLVNVLAAKFDAEPQVAIGAAFMIGAFIGGGLLVFRLGSELIEPLKGNAIEGWVKDKEIAFQKWQIERNNDAETLRGQVQALQADNTKLRDQLALASKRSRVIYKVVEPNGQERITEYSDDAIELEDVFDQFVRGAWAHPTRTRDEWVELLYDHKTERPADGRRRYDDYRRILAGPNVGAWNMSTNQPIGSLADVLRIVSGEPPTPPASAPAGGGAGESSIKS